MGVYVGRRSCYAKNEGAWAPSPGVNLGNMYTIVALILRDLDRGWTYDSKGCTKRVMTEDLARARLIFAIALCRRFTHSDACSAVRQLTPINELLKTRRLPSYLPVFLEGPRARELAEELVRRGIVSWSQVRLPASLSAS